MSKEKKPEKIVVFTDIHFGLRNNENRHNRECLEFIHWVAEQAEEFGADTSIFMGDWHHYRSSVQASTLHYSVQAFDFLSKTFKNHYHIVGNHDLFYKDKRSINSVEFAKDYANIHIINEIAQIGDMLFCPWLVGDEHKNLHNYTQPFVFGHFELPSFLMNAMVAMPNHGKLQPEYFQTKGQRVFSGHFHKRQLKTNEHGAHISYIGNCFPHSYSDTADDDRGVMLLELGKEPQFVKWDKAPKFRNYLLSEILHDPDSCIDHLTNAKVNIDMDLNYEETHYIKDLLQNEYRARELKMIPKRHNFSEVDYDQEEIQFENVDQIVTEQLNSLSNGSMDNQILIDIYNNLI